MLTSVIITIVIVNSSNSFIVRYSLITACIIMALIHHIVRPYSNYLPNVFDRVVLHFIVLVSTLPLVEFFDSVDSNAVAGIKFILVVTPSITYLAMTVMINKARIKKFIVNCYYKCTHLHFGPINYEGLLLDDHAGNETSSGDTYNGRRINKTICDV